MDSNFEPLSPRGHQEMVFASRLQEERFQQLIAEVEDYAIILLDRSGTISYWNKGAQKIKGYTADEIIGKSFRIFYSKHDREDGLPDRLLKTAADENRVAHEGWRVRKDGSRFWGYVVITAIHNEQGEIIGFSKVTRDLTAKKEADDQMKANALELASKNRTLLRLNEEVSSFAYVASHDLKEPLRKIQTFANRILEAKDLNEVKGLAEKIMQGATRMRRLMDDLLDYSSVSNDDSLFRDVDLNHVLQSVLSDLELKIAEKQASIQAETLPVIRGVEFQIHQLLSNLLANALKFSKSNVPPVIVISSMLVKGNDVPAALDASLSYHKVTISDNGMGFNPSDAKRIFNVFQRLQSHAGISGTGIGLAIVKRIMENHGGLVDARSQPGQGASFDLYFQV